MYMESRKGVQMNPFVGQEHLSLLNDSVLNFQATSIKQMKETKVKRIRKDIKLTYLHLLSFTYKPQKMHRKIIRKHRNN